MINWWMFLYLWNVLAYIQQKKKKKKKKKKEEEEEGQTFCHLCHLIMDMFTHTDIFSTLYTQDSWNMIIYTKD